MRYSDVIHLGVLSMFAAAFVATWMMLAVVPCTTDNSCGCIDDCLELATAE